MVCSDLSKSRLSQTNPHERLLSLTVDLLGELLRATPENLGSTITSVLQQFAEACLFDCGIVCRIGPGQGQNTITFAHRWHSAAFAQSGQAGPGLEDETLRALLAQHLQGDAIKTFDRNTHTDSPMLRAYLTQQGLAALCVVPFGGPDGPSGCVALGISQRAGITPRSDAHLLKSIADAIGAALCRVDEAARFATAQAQIAQGYERLKTTLGALSELVLEVDSSGRYVGVYTADTDQMMLPPEQLIGKLHEEVMPAEIAALNRRAMAEVDEKGLSGPHPFWANTPRGRRRYAFTVSSRAPERPGGDSGYVFVARDTTEEWRLAAEAERLGLIARRMTDLVIIIGLDDCIEWVNPAFEARTGWRLEEVRGRTPPDVLHATATDQAEVARIKAEMKAGRPVRSELLNRTRDGEHFWTEIDMQPLRDSDGTLTGYVSIETDITQRKEQAEALARLAQDATEARARLEMAVEALPDAFVYFDAEDRLVLCNTRYRSMFPKFGHHIRPGIRFEDSARALVESGEVPEAKGREDDWVAERLQHHRRASGTHDQLMGGKWIRSIERATPDGGRVGMRIDITEIKEAERRLADIIHGAQAGTWEWNIPLGTNTINERWAQIAGYNLDDLAPMTITTWEKLLHPDDLVAAKQQLARVFAKEIDRFEYELRMRHKAGHWVWVMSRGRVARWSPDGQPEVMAGVHIDITALKGTEDRLAEIIDAAGAGTWELDLTTGSKRVNDRWAEMVGYALEDLAHLPQFGFRDLLHPDDLDILLRQHDTQLTDGNDRFANEIRMRHKAGHWVWVLSRGRVTSRDKDGKPLKVAGIHLDITERMRLQTQLTAERDYLSRLMDTSVSGITALDETGQIIFANPGAERILGLEPAALTKTRYTHVSWDISALDGSSFPAEALPFHRVMTEQRSVKDVRFSIDWPDGTRRMLSVNAAPINAEGLAVRVVCSINDITEQVAAEKKLRDAAEKAEVANRAKSLFLANMSHEIRTPLNGVLGMAQMLESELSTPRHLEMLATIRSSGETLLGVLNDVLDMSKIEAGKLTLAREPFIPAAMAYQIESVHSVMAREKNLSLVFSIDPSAQKPRLGDANRLAQILHNLVGNAIKFTEAGQVDVELGTDSTEAVKLVVTDTGIGMTAEQVMRVFEDFEQADGTVTRRFGGTGLGMSIVKRLVELMGGTITLDSTPNIGTKVTVRLPLDPCQLDPVMAQKDEVASIAGLRVLAADDNKTNRFILGTLMDKLGVDLVLADDGVAAVDAWQPDRFDLYLLDISMPKLDGIATLARLRTLESEVGQCPIPAIAITANVMTHQVEEYRCAGFKGYLGKPFRRDDLLAAIMTVLGRPRPAPGHK